jgi:hypothetical protein
MNEGTILLIYLIVSYCGNGFIYGLFGLLDDDSTGGRMLLLLFSPLSIIVLIPYYVGQYIRNRLQEKEG